MGRLKTLSVELFAPLSKSQKASVMVLVSLNLINMVLVTLGVGALLPIVVLVVETDIPGKYPSLTPYFELLGSPERWTLLIIATAAFAIVIFFKAILGLAILAKQKRLTTDIRIVVSDVLFGRLLALPYSFHRIENSAGLIRNLTSDIAGHGRCLESLILICSEALVILALLFLLFLIDPIGLGVLVGLVLSSAIIYFRFIQPRIALWGQKFRDEARLAFLHTQQAFGAIKEIKILKVEGFFQDLFTGSVRRMTDYERKYAVVQGIPPNGLEVLVAIGVFMLIIGAIPRGLSISDLVPILTLFAASSIRLAPSLAKIAGAYQTLKYNRAAMHALYKRLSDEPHLGGAIDTTRSVASAVLGNWHSIRVTDLGFSYGSRQKFSLKKVNLLMERGCALGIVGESGSGKSTLIDIILGLIENYEGKIEIDGVDLQLLKTAWQSQIGYVPQSVYLIDDSLRKNIALGVPEDQIDEDLLSATVEKAQLADFVSTLESGIDSSVGERGTLLSGGQQQRVGIARALYRNPNVLIMDEATSALDSRTEQEIMETVSGMRGDVTMLIIAHRASTLKCCDRVIRLDNGRIVSEGTYDEVVVDG